MTLITQTFTFDDDSTCYGNRTTLSPDNCNIMSPNFTLYSCSNSCPYIKLDKLHSYALISHYIHALLMHSITHMLIHLSLMDYTYECISNQPKLDTYDDNRSFTIQHNTYTTQQNQNSLVSI